MKESPYLYYTKYYLLTGAFHVAKVVSGLLHFTAEKSTVLTNYLQDKHKSIMLLKINDDIEDDYVIIKRKRDIKAEVQAAEVQAAEVQAAEVQAAEVQAAEVQAAEVQAAEVQAAEVQAAEVQEKKDVTYRSRFDADEEAYAKAQAAQTKLDEEAVQGEVQEAVVQEKKVVTYSSRFDADEEAYALAQAAQQEPFPDQVYDDIYCDKDEHETRSKYILPLRLDEQF